MIPRRNLLAAAPFLAPLAAPRVARAASHRILMVLFRGWEEACDGFRDHFAARGIPVDLIIRDAEQDLRRVPGILAEAKALRPSLVYCWGTSLTMAMLGPYDAPDPEKFLTGVPAVFNIVTDPEGNRLVRSREAPGRPVTGTEYIVPAAVQARAMAAFRPFTKVASLYNPREQNSLLVLDALAAHGDKAGFALRRLPVALADGVPDPASIPGLVAEAAAGGAEWLYVPPDTFLNNHRGVLTAEALRLGLPSFAATERFVTYADGLSGLVSRYYNVGAFTAFKAAQILTEGVAPETIPVEALSRFSLLIRMATARRLGVFPPIGLLRVAEPV